MRQAKPRAPAVSAEEARESILRAIHSSDAPVAAAALGKLPGVRGGAKAKALLVEDLANGRVFDWGSAYWHLDPVKIARERLLDLAAREFLSKNQLTENPAVAAPKLKPQIAKSALRQLIAEKRFRELLIPGAKTKGVVNVEHPEPYLELAIAQVLQSFQVQRPMDRIRALLAPDPAPAPSQDVSEVAEVLFAAMSRLAFAPGTNVTFERLRQQPEFAHIPKKTFDESALLLQKDRRALLNSHGYAGAVSAEEREQLVTDGSGNYYVSIYSR
jgi:hypothetical protein